MLGKRFTRALVVTTTTSLVLAAAAFADTIGGDADFVTGGNQTSINVSGEAGSPFSHDVRLYIQWSGGQHVAQGTSVTFGGALNSACASTVPASTPSGGIAIPSGWASGGVAGPLTATISGTIGGSGSYSCTYRYQATNVGTPQLAPNHFDFTVNFTVSPPAPSDGTPPVITPTVVGVPGNNGWYITNVDLSWSVIDTESPVTSTSGCDAVSITTDQAATTYTCTATSTGGTASESVTIKRDATDPTISGSASPAPNGAGWNNTDVDVTYTCNDNLSGVATCGPDETLSTEGSGLSSTGQAKDNAGNTAQTTVSGINIDKTAPVVTVTGVTDGATYVLGSVPTPGCQTSDALSGVAANASLSTSGGPVGSVTATCSGALDNAGNAGSASATYQVVFDFDGFFQPVDNIPAWNSAKAGQSIPLKFSLEGDQGLGILAGAPKLWKVSCPDASADVLPIDEGSTSTANTGLTYDPIADQYNYVWKTDKRLGGMCYQVDVNLIDGTTHSALFAFKK
jgi:hypothetical protein